MRSEAAVSEVEEEEARADEEEGDGAPGEHFRPKRLGLFRHFPYGTIGAMAMTAAFLGLISLALEVAAGRFLGSGLSAGWPGLPLPFVSAPLGLGALLLTILLARHDARKALAPILSTATYWGAALVIWLGF